MPLVSWRAPLTIPDLQASAVFAVVATLVSARLYQAGTDAVPFRFLGWPVPCLMMCEGDLLAFWFVVAAIALAAMGLAVQGVVTVHRVVAGR